MKKGKILSILMATSITIGAFVGVQIPQVAYAQNIVQENNMNLKDTEDSIDTSSFDSQESFDGNYDDVNESKSEAQVLNDIKIRVPKNYYNFNVKTRVSENYYNFDIEGAQKYTYGTSGNGRPLYYYKIGNGDKVLLLNYGIHGYEDAWNRDGEELTKLAKNLIERVTKDNTSNGLNGWTVIVVPTSNPDGVLDG